MLLIDKLISVDAHSSVAQVNIEGNSSFFEADHGVPAWIGLEYMGQTAALIAGHQKLAGGGQDYVGFLLGTRCYQSHVDHFQLGQILLVQCQQVAAVGESLATFQCTIQLADDGAELASAKLSVLRKPVE